jgi:hypothetical protein
MYVLTSEARFRAHILLLLVDDRSWQDIGSLLYGSASSLPWSR